MSFIAPVLLVLLLAVPVAAGGYVRLDRRRARRAADWGSPALVPNLVARSPGRRRHIPAALLLAGTALLLVGFARPKATITVTRNEATVVLVLDVSGSMAATDVAPSRLGAAKAAAARLVAGLPERYQVAVVTFSDHAAVVAAPTRNRPAVLAALSRAKTGPQGTALTTAVQRAVQVTQVVPAEGKSRPPAVAIVFSDGGQTARGPSPTQVGAAAAKAHVPVTAVAVGTPNGIVRQALPGGYTEQFAVPVESTTLRTITAASGGRLSSGIDAAFLRSVVANLRARAGHEHKHVEVTAAAAGAGVVFMLAGALASGLWFRRIV